MRKTDFFKLTETVPDLDKEAVKVAKDRQAKLAKPPGSLGKLEDMSIHMAGITGKVKNDIKNGCVVIMCADNGVVKEGVSSAPKSVTMAQTINFTRRLTGVGALAKHFGSKLLVVDVGIDGDVPKELIVDGPLENGDITSGIVDRKIAKGTQNLAWDPAMTEEQALAALSAGLEMSKAMKEAGIDIAGVGEMGIGNTTTSAAVLSSLTRLPAVDTVGRGGGINNSAYEKKQEIVFRSVKNLGNIDPKTKDNILTILAAVGGLDIAAMTGVYIGCALQRMPVVVDGYISAVAALTASMMAPGSEKYMFGSHKSCESGYIQTMDILKIKPILDLDMRLGEGVGCPLAFKIIEGACSVMADMATFEEAKINDDYLAEIRRGDCF